MSLSIRGANKNFKKYVLDKNRWQYNEDKTKRR